MTGVFFIPSCCPTSMCIFDREAKAMKKELVQFLSQFDALTESQVHELAGLMTVEEIKKNTLLVREGERCVQCFFILKGCLRQYVMADGVEKTIGLYTEQEAVNFYSNQPEQTVSGSYLMSLEDSVLLIGNPETDEALYAGFPVLADITRQMMEMDLGKIQDSFAKFITSSPEERYLNLLKNKPDLLQRVPQHMIASYLGMAPESLSRIRKRIFVK
jgi:CRP-like cAMP-binding protein